MFRLEALTGGVGLISAIVGKLARVEEDRVTIQVGGMSFEVLASPSTVRELAPRGGQEIRLETIFYIQGSPGGVGNTIPVLVGFLTELEKEFFEHFITVGGIGPRAALKALAIPVPRIARAIENGDIVTLSSLPGIGKQKATKIVAELKGKVGRFGLDVEGAPQPKAAIPVEAGPLDEVTAEAIEVLLQLGYKRQEAEEMIRHTMERRPDITSAEAIIQEIYRSAQRSQGRGDLSGHDGVERDNGTQRAGHRQDIDDAHAGRGAEERRAGSDGGGRRPRRRG